MKINIRLYDREKMHHRGPSTLLHDNTENYPGTERWLHAGAACNSCWCRASARHRRRPRQLPSGCPPRRGAPARQSETETGTVTGAATDETGEYFYFLRPEVPGSALWMLICFLQGVSQPITSSKVLVHKCPLLRLWI